ncbi:MAG: histidine kinase [Paucimonas sp.]|nr:histidine kinase [Paucimonas sp.]
MHSRISAFADGELAESEVDAVLRDLQTSEGRAAWDAYHQIGDLARSEDMDVPLSPGFAARMAARLEAEPTVLAPAAVPAVPSAPAKASSPARRIAVPAFAAAAVAALAFVLTPPVLQALKASGDTVVAAASPSAAQTSAATSHASVIAAVAPAVASPGVLRAADLDEYVLAHQRLSPVLDEAVAAGALAPAATAK